ncbi:DUF1360 domain-containing protein [Nocardioides campestrisoli]|uniref:DUF1360 domain-containing protein n=1 Tax=Nocardioides campestrisoli TaxID=2736757 RepID=UPI0015E786FA|nr:DUF1360 domain-containing protein [Nocardioides campestrisoli]
MDLSASLATKLPTRAYDPDGEVNLAGFAGSMLSYSAMVGLVAAVARARPGTVPERYDLQDLALGGIAAHKLTRLISKSSVASPLRAPFVEFDEPAGSGEHVEHPRDDAGPVRHTIGELLTCPFCLGVWVSTAYVAGLTFAPRATRAAAAVMVVVSASDFLQHAYARLRQD